MEIGFSLACLFVLCVRAAVTNGNVTGKRGWQERYKNMAKHLLKYWKMKYSCWKHFSLCQCRKWAKFFLINLLQASLLIHHNGAVDQNANFYAACSYLIHISTNLAHTVWLEVKFCTKYSGRHELNWVMKLEGRFCFIWKKKSSSVITLHQWFFF